MSLYNTLIILVVILLAYETVQCQTGHQNTGTPGTRGQPTIIIIGAGLSGLAAADRLINKYGFQNVKILEAQDRVGGRVYPVPFGSTFIQIGAEWLHNRKNPVFEMALELGLISNRNVTPDDFFQGLRYIDQNSCEVEDRLHHALDHISSLQVIQKAKGASYGDRMDNLYKRFIKNHLSNYSASDIKVLDAIMRIQKSDVEEYYSAEDWHNISLEEPDDDDTDEEDEKDDEGEEINIHLNQFGYKLILDEMTKRVPPNKYIQFNSLVQRIRWNNNSSKNIEIELSNGSLISADHVIVTCSIGHLKHNAQRLFDPLLPKKKMDTIEALGFGAVDKFLLIFDKPWWPKNTTTIYFLRVDNGTTCRTTPAFVETNLTKMLQVALPSPVYPNHLLFWIGGHDPPTYENATDADLIGAAMTVLRNYFQGVTIPEPKIMRSSWYSNPLFRGSYSYNSVALDKIKGKRSDLAEPLEIVKQNQKIPVVQFAGEATHSEYATTHGAFMSGEREADRLGSFYKTK